MLTGGTRIEFASCTVRKVVGARAAARSARACGIGAFDFSKPRVACGSGRGALDAAGAFNVLGADFADGRVLFPIAVPGLESVAAVGLVDVDLPNVEDAVGLVTAGAGRAATGGARVYWFLMNIFWGSCGLRSASLLVGLTSFLGGLTFVVGKVGNMLLGGGGGGISSAESVPWSFGAEFIRKDSGRGTAVLADGACLRLL